MTRAGRAGLSDGALAEADELLGRVNHDVAKYMSMTARNVDPDALTPEIAGWLRADLLRTDGARPAWDLWRERAAALAGVLDDPEVARIASEMDRLEGLVEAWREDDLVAGAEVARVARSVADRIAALRREVRQLRRERGS